MAETRADLEADVFEIELHRSTGRKQLFSGLAVFALCGLAGAFFGVIPWVIGFLVCAGMVTSAEQHRRKARVLAAKTGNR